MRALVRVSGGTGNQFFQIGFGNFLIEQFGFSVTYDISFFTSKPNESTHRIFRGDVIFPEGKYENQNLLQIEKKRARVEKLRMPKIIKHIIWKTILLKLFCAKRQIVFHDFKPSRLKNLSYKHFTHVYIGDWQNYRYITESFVGVVNSQLSRINMISKLDCLNDYLGIHIRRGDYLDDNSIHKVLDWKYYYEAMTAISERKPSLKLLVFSDDESAALDLITNYSGTVMASSLTKDDLNQIYAMSQMNYLVISNSSFSFMAALLGKKSKFVVAPSQWFKLLDKKELPLVPSNWKII